VTTLSRTRLDEVYALLREPADSLFTRFGIQTRSSTKGNAVWKNLSTCPWCNHGPDNYQCGVAESQGDNGYVHAVRCMHPHHSPTSEEAPHYADFLAALGAITHEEAQHVKDSRNKVRTVRTVNTVSKQAPRPAAGPELGLMNEEHNAKGRRRLRENKAAMHYLTEVRGFLPATIERFKLGLSEPYVKDGIQIHAHALAAPLVGFDGGFYKKYVNYAIPKVTLDNRDKPQKAWSPGPARAYYSGDCRKKPWLFICDGLKDLWALSQLLEGTELQDSLALASSTNGGQGLPDEWKGMDFWSRWEKVFAGHDNDRPDPLTGKCAGDEHALALARLADRDVLRVTPPGVKDWNDWVLAGHTAEDFRRLLEEGEALQVEAPIQANDDGVSEGRFSANPVSIVGAFHNGHLYEAVRTVRRDIDRETGELLEKYETVVIRSDGTEHYVRRMPAPKGTPESNIIRRLYPDGTLLSVEPEPNPNLTWSWESIQAWRDGSGKSPALGPLLKRITNHLRGSVWLPYSDDYTMLACAVAASFVQQVFDAVPLILVTGAAGTGKSELGLAMKSMGANSKNVLGVVSAATLARHIDATRGLVVIDDLEEIANSKDTSFGDIVQSLKLSYKKSTAMKLVTEMKNGKATPRQFNFFGIKVINNTRGADAILGTRMLTVQTRHMPKGLRLDHETTMTPDQLDELRNHLHTWAFSNVKDVQSSYQAIFPNKSSRQEEISAPLRVIAALSGDEAVRQSLERALDKQSKLKKDPDSPEEILAEAVRSIVRRSIERTGMVQTWVTVTQVMLEAQSMVDNNYGKEFTTSLSAIEKPEWIGRTIRQVYAKDPNNLSARTNMYGKGLRAYELSDEFISDVMGQLEKESPDLFRLPLKSTSDFKAFCAGCPTCPYRSRCDMQSEREKSEARKSGG
jgi:hypothetical protein